MGFSTEQIALLKAPLDRANVSTRKQAGMNLSYIEGWHAIDEANRIFGFDEWSRETLEMSEVRCNEVGDKWRVGFMARVRVHVGGIFRDGTGYGSGISKDLGDAYESAVKEAETDAMKRALMTFGNPFGLALYDKSQASVVDTPPPPKPTAAESMIANRPDGKRYDNPADSKLALQGHMTAMALATTQAELKDFCATNKREIDHLLDADWADLAVAVKKRMTELPEGVAQDNAA
jgi:DNA repair and recombination protein RAD52